MKQKPQFMVYVPNHSGLLGSEEPLQSFSDTVVSVHQLTATQAGQVSGSPLTCFLPAAGHHTKDELKAVICFLGGKKKRMGQTFAGWGISPKFHVLLTESPRTMLLPSHKTT